MREFEWGLPLRLSTGPSPALANRQMKCCWQGLSAIVLYTRTDEQKATSFGTARVNIDSVGQQDKDNIVMAIKSCKMDSTELSSVRSLPLNLVLVVSLRTVLIRTLVRIGGIATGRIVRTVEPSAP